MDDADKGSSFFYFFMRVWVGGEERHIKWKYNECMAFNIIIYLQKKCREIRKMWFAVHRK